MRRDEKHRARRHGVWSTRANAYPPQDATTSCAS